MKVVYLPLFNSSVFIACSLFELAFIMSTHMLCACVLYFVLSCLVLSCLVLSCVVVVHCSCIVFNLLVFVVLCSAMLCCYVVLTRGLHHPHCRADHSLRRVSAGAVYYHGHYLPATQQVGKLIYHSINYMCI